MGRDLRAGARSGQASAMRRGLASGEVKGDPKCMKE